jgi:hypothetical protein
MPTANMYCAVLKTTRIAGLRRTNVSTTAAVVPEIITGHGWGKSMAEARNGTNATELLMFANDILRNDVSQAIAKIAKAMKPFQNFESEVDGKDQGSANNPANAAIAVRAIRA